MTVLTATAAVFMSGNNQAIRLPKSFQLHSKRVQIERRGAEIVLREIPPTMADFLAKLPIVKDWPDVNDEYLEKPIQAW